MKKMFGLMVLAGVILAASTAGACDAGVMGADRILLQSLISAALIYFGTRFKEWGDEPNMVLIGKFSAIMHQNAHRYTKYRFRFWHTLTKKFARLKLCDPFRRKN